jgi:hypothetical protein
MVGGLNGSVRAGIVLLKNHPAFSTPLRGHDLGSRADAAKLDTVEVAVDGGATREQLPVHRPMHGPEHAEHTLFCVAWSNWSRLRGFVGEEPLGSLDTAIVVDPRFIACDDPAEQSSLPVAAEQFLTRVHAVLLLCWGQVMGDIAPPPPRAPELAEPTPCGGWMAEPLRQFHGRLGPVPFEATAQGPSVHRDWPSGTLPVCDRDAPLPKELEPAACRACFDLVPAYERIDVSSCSGRFFALFELLV